MNEEPINHATIWLPVIAALAVILVVALTLSLSGCAATGPSSSATDWRTIHQPAPTTPGGGDGHGN